MKVICNRIHTSWCRSGDCLMRFNTICIHSVPHNPDESDYDCTVIDFCEGSDGVLRNTWCEEIREGKK